MNNRLTARDRDYILLLHKHGSNVTEIASASRRSLVTVRKILQKAGVTAGLAGRPTERIVATGESGSFWGGDQ